MSQAAEAPEPEAADPVRPSLRQVLRAVADPLIEVLTAPKGLEVPVNNVVIVDPDDAVETYTGDLALVIGARGREAAHLVRAAGHRGAAAVAVKVSGPEESKALRRAATDSGAALLAVYPEVRWEQLEALCRSVVTEVRSTPETDLGGSTGDLFALAQTIAALTGGLVSIEDSASRVLAYSGNGEEMDELRRLSVLGRQGPEQYLALLREWGVFRRLRSSSEAICVDERPDLGIRRRFAVGIHAGTQVLGTIWVQEGKRPFAEQTEETLMGAARVAALHLLRSRIGGTSSPRLGHDVLADLLEGRAETAAAAGSAPVSTEQPAAVAVFVAHAHDPHRGADRPEAELARRQLVNLVEVHAAAYRQKVLVTTLGPRVYALLPADAAAGRDSGVPNLARRVVSAARSLLDPATQGAVGSAASGLHQVAESREEADRVLDAMGREPSLEVAGIADVRSKVLVAETLERLRAEPRLRDPRVAAVADHDARFGSGLARSLLAYLQDLGDVRAAADRLHIHPNTLRYRLRRLEEVSGMDLSDPNQRLFAHLQLLLDEA